MTTVLRGLPKFFREKKKVNTLTVTLVTFVCTNYTYIRYQRRHNTTHSLQVAVGLLWLVIKRMMDRRRKNDHDDDEEREREKESILLLTHSLSIQ